MGNLCSRSRADTSHDNEKRFLEDMLEKNKVDGDPRKKQELTEIQSCLEEKLRKACERLEGTKLEVAEIVLCGSMAEGTRVWEYEYIVLKDENNKSKSKRKLAIEFDFLAVLKIPAITKKRKGSNKADKHGDQTCMTYRVVKSSCKGHKVNMDCIDTSSRQLKSGAIRHDLRAEIVQFLNEDKTESRLVYHKVRQHLNDRRIRYKFVWKHCGLHKESNATRSSSGQHTTCIVNVDLMPAFVYEGTNKKGPGYLVAKSQCAHNACFMKSYCMEEMRMLEASPVHREVYILLKSFNMETSNRAPSYFLKTAVLRHIEECKRPNVFVCHRQLLQFLTRSYSHGELMTLRGQMNLLLGIQLLPDARDFAIGILEFLKNMKYERNRRYSFTYYKNELERHIGNFEREVPIDLDIHARGAFQCLWHAKSSSRIDSISSMSRTGSSMSVC